MMWLRIDDQFSDHPKLVRAGDLAAWLHVCGLCYCARHLTDGLIPLGQAERMDYSGERIERLVSAGLWEKTEDGYLVHDYLDYNPSRAEVLASREANARYQATWRNKHRGENGAFTQDSKDNSNDNSKGLDKDIVRPFPSPSPSPMRNTDKGATPTSYNDWLRAIKDPKSIGETNGHAVLVRMGQSLYPNFETDGSVYGRVGKLVKKLGSQSQFATLLWTNAARSLVSPLDYLTKAINIKAREDERDPEPPPQRFLTVDRVTGEWVEVAP